MRTVHAAATSVSILFSGETPPDRRRMLALVRDALTAAGLSPWEEMEADCFRAGGETLLLARPGTGTRYFGFDDMDSLLAGISGCAGGGGSLYRAGAGYVLAVPSGTAGPGLYEYGRRKKLSPLWEVHAREQELCLLPENALSALRRGRWKDEHDIIC